MIATKAEKEYFAWISFHSDEANSSMLTAELPENAVLELGNKCTVAFPGRKNLRTGEEDPRLQVFTENEWKKLQSSKAQDDTPFCEDDYRKMLALMMEHSAECDISNGRISIPSRLAAMADIQYQARIYHVAGSCYMEAFDGEPPDDEDMDEDPAWLEWYLDWYFLM